MYVLCKNVLCWSNDERVGNTLSLRVAGGKSVRHFGYMHDVITLPDM